MRKRKPEELKDSGIKWLGKIPKNWELTQLKFLATINGRIGFRGYTIDDIVNKGAGPITLSPSNIKNDKLELTENTYISWEKYHESPEIKIYPSDIILVKTGSTIGKSALIPEDVPEMTINPQLVVLKKLKVSPEYLYYQTISPHIKNSFHVEQAGGSTPSISQEKIKSFPCLLLSNSEQKAITTFLDLKTQAIDQLLEKKQQLIEKLKEKRQALITRAVIKGLNPDATLKDSGIEWLGEIPEHWERAKIIYYSKLETGGTPSKNNKSYWENGTINWMTSGEVNKTIVDQIDNKITEQGMRDSNAKILPANTIMIALNGQGKTKGMSAILKTPSTCNQSLAGFICDEQELHYRYLFYFLQAKYKEIRGLVGDKRRDGITLGLLKTLYISLPPLYEQKEIADKIDKYLNSYRLLKEKIETEIKKIDEYRQSLISAAVTGKIDVRDQKHIEN